MTFAELQSYVLERLSLPAADSAKVTQIKGQLNREYLRVVSEEGLNLSRAELPLTESDPLVDLPDDWTRIRSVRIGSTVLTPFDRQELAAREAELALLETDTGPQWYCVEPPGRIRLLPSPTEDDNDGCILDYEARPETMSADSDTPSVLPEEYHDYLAECVVERIALAEEEPGLAQAAGTLAKDLRAQMRAHLANARYGDVFPQIQPRGLGR